MIASKYILDKGVLQHKQAFTFKISKTVCYSFIVIILVDIATIEILLLT